MCCPWSEGQVWWLRSKQRGLACAGHKPYTGESQSGRHLWMGKNHLDQLGRFWSWLVVRLAFSVLRTILLLNHFWGIVIVCSSTLSCNNVSMAMFTLQFLVLNLDLLFRSDFISFGCSHYFLNVANVRLKCGLVMVLSWPACAKEQYRQRRHTSAFCPMGKNMEATEFNVYGFICKLICSGNQHICEQMITRRMRKREPHF